MEEREGSLGVRSKGNWNTLGKEGEGQRGEGERGTVEREEGRQRGEQCQKKEREKEKKCPNPNP